MLKDKLTVDAKRLAWYISISDENSGRFLRARPKSEDFTFTNDAFSAIVCYRLCHKQQSYIIGSKCYCKRSLNGMWLTGFQKSNS